ncbi:haloacid dehalogenase-like hydrolase domain-containing protein, partial [Quercus suber]
RFNRYSLPQLLCYFLQDWKTERYKEIIKSGALEPRPGVLRLMDEAKAAERFQSLDCFLAGDDVKEKKPDPSIYLTASNRLGVSPRDCLVVEDSVIGLQVLTICSSIDKLDKQPFEQIKKEMVRTLVCK